MKKILIFDDDEDILSICTFILEDDGWQVKSYPDCSNIVERVISFSPDVILMDNWIPADGGIPATRLIKAAPETTHIPVIYFSANSDIEALAAKAGTNLCLSKPFELDELKQAVANALAE